MQCPTIDPCNSLNSCYSVVQVFGWDENGTMIFNDVLCTENTAYRNGGCFSASGRGVVNDGTAMTGNVALNGGSIRECNVNRCVFFLSP